VNFTHSSLLEKETDMIEVQSPIDSQGLKNIRKFNFTADKFEDLSLGCDLYKVLRRGSNQKVISFSLYGKF